MTPRKILATGCLFCIVCSSGCGKEEQRSALAGKADSSQVDRSNKQEVDPILELSLKAAYSDYHRGMTSDTKADQSKALDAWIAKPGDAKTVLAKYPQAVNLYSFVLTSARKDVDEYAAGEKRSGKIKRLTAIDARLASTPVSAVLDIVPKHIPVFVLRVEYESHRTVYGPLLKVNNRWVWMPGLERMAPAIKSLKQS